MKVSQSTQVAEAAVTSSASDTIIARRVEGEVVFIVWTCPALTALNESPEHTKNHLSLAITLIFVNSDSIYAKNKMLCLVASSR